MNHPAVHFGIGEIQRVAAVENPRLRDMMLAPVINHSRKCTICELRLNGVMAVIDSQREDEMEDEEQ